MIVLVSVIFRACALSLIYDGLSRFSHSTALQQGSASSTGFKLCSCLCSASCVRCLIWLSYSGSPEIVKSMQNVNFFNHWNKLVFDSFFTLYNHVFYYFSISILRLPSRKLKVKVKVKKHFEHSHSYVKHLCGVINPTHAVFMLV